MTSNNIRQLFLDFFKQKEHKITTSAPMVIKNDPTLMFTNAGMNQFKDIFLGNITPKHLRVANTQKCLRVSGKHNDLEQVGVDTYHHTMFEMLGNWSFGDYFKKEAIEWAWELLTKVYGIEKGRMYVTVFGGDKEDNLQKDNEAIQYWKNFIAEDRILLFGKKDNFWEMGNTGPCGPCSEIHIDLRDEKDRKRIDAKELINKDNPFVIELWNLVFIEFNRIWNPQKGGMGELLAFEKAYKGKNFLIDRTNKLKELTLLVDLPNKHVDTGMGFERLCMVLQSKKSNYDTDVFQPLIKKIEALSNKQCRESEKTEIAMRVIADHVRAITFSIADGQLPSNTGAGYVIRRILRRAVRYGYSFLDIKEAFIYQLVPVLVEQMGEQFPEIKAQQDLIQKVIHEEEESFMRTLGKGIVKIDEFVKKRAFHDERLLVALSKIDSEVKDYKTPIAGDFAFELYDTFGFPIDLTQLIAREKGYEVDMDGFNQCLEEQKSRSRQASVVDAEDWIELYKDDREEFVGFDYLETDVKITRYRKVTAKGKELYHLVFNITPFYAESGGQVGDTGYIETNGEKTSIKDTKKENELIIHIAEKLPTDIKATFKAHVNKEKRLATVNNHTATHLMQHILRKVLGEHVEQRGSYVHPDHLRFDFSHFQKVTEEEIATIEGMVNEMIRANSPLEEQRAIPMNEAKAMGAMALFGEKYGDLVRVIKFGDSIELCGGTHVRATGQIGMFKITSESAIAAGIRRIEAITSKKAEAFINGELDKVKEIKMLLKQPKDVVKSVQELHQQNVELIKKLEKMNRQAAEEIKKTLLTQIEKVNGVNCIAAKVQLDSADAIKNLAFQLRNQVEDLLLVIGAEIDGKALLTVLLSDNLIKEKGLNANTIIRELAKEINGGGGGQPFYATAGGKDVSGLAKAVERATEFVKINIKQP